MLKSAQQLIYLLFLLLSIIFKIIYKQAAWRIPERITISLKVSCAVVIVLKLQPDTRQACFFLEKYKSKSNIRILFSEC